jgi:tetratricopeptide (TPR) repeat protein
MAGANPVLTMPTRSAQRPGRPLARPLDLTLGRLLAPMLLAGAACVASPLVHPRAAEELRRGYAHLEAGDGERAEVAFEHALEFAPDLPEGWNGLGVVARGRDDAAAAHDHFAHAVRLAPGFAEGHANLGEALLTLERPGEAVEALRAALRIDPDLAAARQNLARALLHLGLAEPAEREARWKEARREYLHLLESLPDAPAAHADLAFIDYLSGRYAAAERGYRRAAEAAPTAERLHGLCLSLVRLGRCGEALAACDRCLALDPGAPGCQKSRAGAAACVD